MLIASGRAFLRGGAFPDVRPVADLESEREDRNEADLHGKGMVGHEAAGRPVPGSRKARCRGLCYPGTDEAAAPIRRETAR